MTAHDPRLDPGVRAARRVEWEDPKQWDDRQWDNALLRSGWMERLAPYDPTPEYFARESAEGWGDEPTADDLSDIHGYHTLTKTICVTVCIGWWVFVIFAIGFMVGGRYA